ncbi:MAG: hypothetical protein ABGX47_07425 [Martelella sp.]|uniref:hypothetical protein n=1 Tax=Martelella sp. TaxID=1969699 RepID=UPI003242F45B
MQYTTALVSIFALPLKRSVKRMKLGVDTVEIDMHDRANPSSVARTCCSLNSLESAIIGAPWQTGRR